GSTADQVGQADRGQGMRAARGLLVVVGLGFGVWGVWLMRDFSASQGVSLAIWLVGGVVLHDALLAPITVGTGVLAAKSLPSHVRAVAAVAFVIWGTVTITVANVLLGVGGKADNETLLGRPYV